MRKPLTRTEAHKYWSAPPHANRAGRYLGRPSYKAVVRLAEKHIAKDARILELGCSVGTTLDAMHQAGYHDLTGIEINPQAVEILRKKYPRLEGCEVVCAPIEEAITQLGEFDLVYSKAVLCHLHTASEGVFAEIAQRTRWIITVEDEYTTSSERHFPRNYRRVFAPFGFRQVEYVHQPEGMGAAYVGRVMTR